MSHELLCRLNATRLSLLDLRLTVQSTCCKHAGFDTSVKQPDRVGSFLPCCRLAGAATNASSGTPKHESGLGDVGFQGDAVQFGAAADHMPWLARAAVRGSADARGRTRTAPSTPSSSSTDVKYYSLGRSSMLLQTLLPLGKLLSFTRGLTSAAHQEEASAAQDNSNVSSRTPGDHAMAGEDVVPWGVGDDLLNRTARPVRGHGNWQSGRSLKSREQSDARRARRPHKDARKPAQARQKRQPAGTGRWAGLIAAQDVLEISQLPQKRSSESGPAIARAGKQAPAGWATGAQLEATQREAGAAGPSIGVQQVAGAQNENRTVHWKGTDMLSSLAVAASGGTDCKGKGQRRRKEQHDRGAGSTGSSGGHQAVEESWQAGLARGCSLLELRVAEAQALMSLLKQGSGMQRHPEDTAELNARLSSCLLATSQLASSSAPSSPPVPGRAAAAAKLQPAAQLQPVEEQLASLQKALALLQQMVQDTSAYLRLGAPALAVPPSPRAASYQRPGASFPEASSTAESMVADAAGCRAGSVHFSVAEGSPQTQEEEVVTAWGRDEFLASWLGSQSDADHSANSRRGHDHRSDSAAMELSSAAQEVIRQQQRGTRLQGHEGHRNGSGDGRDRRKGGASAGRQPQQEAVQLQLEEEEVLLSPGLTLQELAKLLRLEGAEVEQQLAEMGSSYQSLEEVVDLDAAELLALENGFNPRRVGGKERTDAVERPAVITIMGHVDHGKTTLLDALRRTQVAAGEAGGITQHIGAFSVTMPGSSRSLTFLDTPGHAAFAQMRSRGASVTDIVVLVVGADDGVQPQTCEAIQHARAAGCPTLVALTKCDRPEADPERALQQLLEQGLELESAGGDIQVVRTAAVKDEGLKELEEALLFMADLLELRASPGVGAEATVVECRMDRGQGPLATVIVREGTLQVGAPVVVGDSWGRVRALRDCGGKALKRAPPGTPVEVSGLRTLPQAGDNLTVVGSEDRARRLASARGDRRTERQLRAAKAEDLGAEEDGPTVLPLVVKADVHGTIEALEQTICGLRTETARMKVVGSGLGPVTVGDVQLAVSTGATVLAFNVKASDKTVQREAASGDVRIIRSRVIYHLIDSLVELLKQDSPDLAMEEKVVGKAEVVQTFKLHGRRQGKDAGVVAGCRVVDGSINTAAARWRVVRRGQVLYEGSCTSLRREKLEVQQVGMGVECGVMLDFNDFQPGDELLCIEDIPRSASLQP